MSRTHIIAHGRVQGVGFRYFLLKLAQESNIGGWARNLPDGTVEIDADGTDDALEQFIEDVRRGPRFSNVTHLDINPAPALEGKRGFHIR